MPCALQVREEAASNEPEAEAKKALNVPIPVELAQRLLGIIQARAGPLHCVGMGGWVGRRRVVGGVGTGELRSSPSLCIPTPALSPFWGGFNKGKVFPPAPQEAEARGEAFDTASTSKMWALRHLVRHCLAQKEQLIVVAERCGGLGLWLRALGGRRLVLLLL